MFRSVKAKVAAGGAALLGGMGSALADGGYADDAATAISGVEGDIITVGGAIVALAAVALGIKWVKAMFF